MRFLPLSALLTAAALAAAAPANAQYLGDAPPPPAPLAQGTVERPAEALARNVRILAASPRNFLALMAAGRAALDLGDLNAAAGFFARADEVNPNSPMPKVGMGATTLQTGDARAALTWFAQAQRLGATTMTLGADRGLAHDLLGELNEAQADYRAALVGPTPDEARRRLALSLAISGKTDEAVATLAPLSRKGDPAVGRIRAFVLALGGDSAGAARTIEMAMPGSSARISPFFAMLPRLTTVQKARAVHLGVFPEPGEIRLAAAAPPPAAAITPSAPAQKVAPEPRKARPKREKVIEGRFRPAPLPAPQPQPPPVAATQPPAAATQVPVAATQLPVAAPQPVTLSPAAPPASQPIAQPVPQLVASPPSEPIAEPAGEPIRVAAIDLPETPVQQPSSGDRLSGIDKLLAQTIDPAPRRAAARPPAAARKPEPAEPKEAKLGVSGTHWVQLAGGQHQERMAAEYKRIRAKQAALFAGKSGHVSEGKEYFRLLVGPFKTAAEANAFVNSLDKAGIDSFHWTRTPAQIRIEKLPAK